MKNIRFLFYASCILSVFILPAVPAYAYTFVQEDEAGFLSWYEENKDSANAVYTLQGDLVLGSGTGESPIILDGTGNITVDCGGHIIVACSSVVLDNPNLTIKGNSFCTIQFTGGALSLQQGTVSADTDSGYAIYVTGENPSLISPVAGRAAESAALSEPAGAAEPGGASAPGGRFLIEAKGNCVTGIYYDGPDGISLSNLDIRVNGAQNGTGIEFYKTRAAIDNCTINVTGKSEVYGLYNYSSLEIAGSSVQALGTDENAVCYSACSRLADAALTWDGASVLKPAPSDSGSMEKMYTVLQQASRDVVTIPTGSCTAGDAAAYPSGSRLAGDFPEEVRLVICDEMTSESLEVSLPVEWDLSTLDTTSPGVFTVYGTFDPGSLDGTCRNPNNVRPELCVICVEDNHIFIQNWSAYESDDGHTQLQMTVPYPQDAASLRMQYSTDGLHYTDYSYNGEDNILAVLPDEYSDALLSFFMDIPFSSPTLYLRAVISGETLYAGVSPVWKLDIASGGGERPEPEYDGDRGGQTVDPEGSGTSGDGTSGGDTSGLDSPGDDVSGSGISGSTPSGPEGNTPGSGSRGPDSAEDKKEYIVTYKAQKKNSALSAPENDADEPASLIPYEQQSGGTDFAPEEYPASAKPSSALDGETAGKTRSFPWILVAGLLILSAFTGIVVIKKRASHA